MMHDKAPDPLVGGFVVPGPVSPMPVLAGGQYNHPDHTSCSWQPAWRLTLVEVMIVFVILAVVVTTMGIGTTKFSRSIRDSDVRNRAQSLADMQIVRARGWSLA